MRFFGHAKLINDFKLNKVSIYLDFANTFVKYMH
jgi:hypothetical protein